ncbi:phage tail protein [Trujillonella humicola]|uniref:phage tail protein n=1 Tax=Trujillonella humicola TaxID=3383699 RepID=UPI0039058857
MPDPFVAEIQVFGFAFPPNGWAQCNGQIMPISQNTALFALLGTTYGGNGQSVFALPDLLGRVPLHPGQGPGLSGYDLGQTGGSDTVTLLESEIPVHTHQVSASDGAGGGRTAVPAGGVWGESEEDPWSTGTPGAAMSPMGTSIAGSGQPHPNTMPSLVLNFCIALQGVFPPRP